jgi:hypothetical protein
MSSMIVLRNTSTLINLGRNTTDQDTNSKLPFGIAIEIQKTTGKDPARITKMVTKASSDQIIYCPKSYTLFIEPSNGNGYVL